MIINPFFLLSILISAVLTFITATFVIDIVLAFLQIKQSRTKAILRLIAFSSLLLEVSYHGLGKYNYLNPLSCFSCTQKLILSKFFPDLNAFLSEHQISLINYLAIDNYHAFFAFLFIGWLLTTVFMVLRFCLRVFWINQWLQNIIQSSKNCERVIQNTQLLEALKTKDVRIYVSQSVTVPMATYIRTIVMPQYLISQLSDEEFESIIAHELEHIKTGDPMIRLFIDGLSALFWWVPSSWYRKKIERDQEMACDRAIINYGYDSSFLASALIKVSKQKCAMNESYVCSLSGNENGVKSRLQVILGINAPPKESIVLASLIVGIEGVILLMCIISL